MPKGRARPGEAEYQNFSPPLPRTFLCQEDHEPLYPTSLSSLICKMELIIILSLKVAEKIK